MAYLQKCINHHKEQNNCRISLSSISTVNINGEVIYIHDNYDVYDAYTDFQRSFRELFPNERNISPKKKNQKDKCEIYPVPITSTL